ncbi:MAG: bifunctional UDP-N-acetylmuramoyl-tripeptide:D-alanyl-D-alanine ligase/alanine racemase [Prolixibacteraceae bacterium]|nr:bifunctional UDP-N-acetylmuramoyl-tripeptide:D-alanyl-D-alanine ligase/alanine racemase [Prolixibacteraceae bacterium]
MSRDSLEKIAAVVGGKIIRNDMGSGYYIEKIAIDSRTLLAGDRTLFFAILGKINNGHHYIPALADSGVQAFVVSEDVEIDVREKVAVIKVDDVSGALQKLAAYHRASFDYPVIGIAGSNGKTVVKEWLYDILADNFSIVRSPRSYNSQVGVPLSVWNMRDENTLAIFEAGISMPGEMEKLEPVIGPQIGIFTNIGDAHQENFRSFEQKISEKLKLFVHSGKLIFCADQDETAPLIYDFCAENGVVPVGWSGKEKEASIHFSVTENSGRTDISAYWNNNKADFTIPFADASSVENACQCFAALTVLDAVSEPVLRKFETLAPLAMRLELKKGVHDSLLLNDYYNSDVNSLEIALSVLNVQAEKNGLKKTVILSDIRQSGFAPSELYGNVNRMLANAGVELLAGVGNEIMQADACFSMEKIFFKSTEEFIRNMNPRDFSQSAVLLKGAREFHFESISAALQKKAHQTVLEINMNALVHNLNVFRSLLRPETKTMVMVKAFSYGAGDVEIARTLQFHRVDYLAVAVADEGVELRNAGIVMPIVVMNPENHSFQLLIDYRLEPNLYSYELAYGFAAALTLNAVQDFPIHLKIDTGMNRLGFKSEEEIKRLSDFLLHNKQMKISSVFSHLAASDEPAYDDFTLEQIGRFEYLTALLIQHFPYKIDRHILNSSGMERFSQYQFNMVRLGIGLYGVSRANNPLLPIGVLKSVVSQIKTVVPDETIGYGRSGKIDIASEIAVIPVGYADGLNRRLGNGVGKVVVNGKKAPIIGNICMDMCMADITGIDVKVGDEVEFFGRNVSIEEIAATLGTIPYEILTGISQRVKRIYIQE